MLERDSTPLRLSRETRAMTQVELAARAGVSLSGLREAEASGIVTDRMARRIARALGAPAEERLSWRRHAVDSRAAKVAAKLEPASPRRTLAEALVEKYARQRGDPQDGAHDASAEAPAPAASAEGMP